MPKESIIDASMPSAGRIYDYILGGHHNFEVDRQAAEQIMRVLPSLPKVMRLQRWCLQDIAVELTQKRGFDTIIDFASGLPTQDHIHFVVPEGTIVIYSDRDPIIVEYAREILGDTPNVYYFEADARQPEELLNRPEVEDILQGKRNVGLVYWGISNFLTDEELRHAAQSLYEWSKQSCWAFNAMAADADPSNPLVVQLDAIYRRMGSPLYGRSLDRVQELLSPWQEDDQGFVSFFQWHGIDRSEMDEQDRKALGAGGAGYGVYLIK